MNDLPAPTKALVNWTPTNQGKSSWYKQRPPDKGRGVPRVGCSLPGRELPKLICSKNRSTKKVHLLDTLGPVVQRVYKRKLIPTPGQPWTVFQGHVLGAPRKAGNALIEAPTWDSCGLSGLPSIKGPITKQCSVSSTPLPEPGPAPAAWEPPNA